MLLLGAEVDGAEHLLQYLAIVIARRRNPMWMELRYAALDLKATID